MANPNLSDSLLTITHTAVQWQPDAAEVDHSQLLTALSQRRLLLLLDNLEHLPGIADLLGDILAAAPGVQILGTIYCRRSQYTGCAADAAPVGQQILSGQRPAARGALAARAGSC